MKLDSLVQSSKLLSRLREEDLEFLGSVATEVALPAGTVAMSEGESADQFFIVAEGKVGLELVSEGREPVIVETLGPGDLVGVSWLFPPYRWAWTARAVVDSSLVSFDAVQVRKRSDDDVELRNRLLESIGRAAIRRLQATRLQLLNLFEMNR